MPAFAFLREIRVSLAFSKEARRSHFTFLRIRKADLRLSAEESLKITALLQNHYEIRSVLCKR